MAAIPILNGVYADNAGDFRTSYPRNMVPVPKAQGISAEYLRPSDGVQQFGTGPGTDRGGINWNGQHLRVMGTKLVSVSAAGAVAILGDVGGAGQVTLDQGFGRVAIASGGGLYYWDGSTLVRVVDGDLGPVLDVQWIAGYFMTTDGTSLVVTDLDDPLAVNPLKYGSAEADPDPIMAVEKLRNEAYALNRYTIEVFQNVGGDGFPFQRIDGAHVTKGLIGTHAYVNTGSTLVFMGSARNEAPGVYMMGQGSAEKVSSREIDTILEGYTEAELSAVVAERRASKNHDHILFHLPDQCLVFDATASQAASQLIWFTLTSSVVGLGTYRAKNAVWVHDQWVCGDPLTSNLGTLTNAVGSHYGQRVGWEFGTVILYNEGNDAIVHELELVCLSGRVASDVDPTIMTSYSRDGQTWSQERSTRAGKAGQRAQRICWRTQGTIGHQRIQKFRGTSDAHLTIAKLQLQLEPLMTRPGSA
jgi:hypothetical protein